MEKESFKVLYEDNHLLIVNKGSGVLVQKDKNGDEALEEILKEYLKIKYAKPGEVFLGVVHRLDRPVSGIVVFAKTSKALIRMNEMFRSRDIEKTYWAVVANKPAQKKAILSNWLTRSETKNFSKIYDREVKNSLKAELQYEVIAESEKYNLLEVNLMTGRHHQIRAQLSYIKCPIVGDLKYGYARSSPEGTIFLHARKIKFIHPVKKEVIEIEAEMPIYWKKYGFN